jgi:hypothetical protein
LKKSANLEQIRARFFTRLNQRKAPAVTLLKYGFCFIPLRHLINELKLSFQLLGAFKMNN